MRLSRDFLIWGILDARKPRAQARSCLHRYGLLLVRTTYLSPAREVSRPRHAFLDKIGQQSHGFAACSLITASAESRHTQAYVPRAAHAAGLKYVAVPICIKLYIRLLFPLERSWPCLSVTQHRSLQVQVSQSCLLFTCLAPHQSLLKAVN
jgi:hypothetical protein